MATEPTIAASPALSPALAACVEGERRRGDVAGISVAVFDRDGVRATQGFGFADFERDEPVTPDTVFRAASISKLFTTVLVLQEVEAGRLNLDSPVNDYLDPRFHLRDQWGRPVPATLRQLLTHTSGLPVSWRGLESKDMLFRVVMNGLVVPHKLEDVVAGMRTIRSPGKRMMYSNGAFNLLGYLVSRMGRRGFRKLVGERLLAPLGMSRSSFPPDISGPGTATPYGGMMNTAGRRPAPQIRIYAAPAGGLMTSALDLARFGRMLLRGGELDGERYLSEETLADAFRLHARNHPDLEDGLGLGFWVSRYRGRSLIWHDGGLPGVATHIGLLPDDGIGVVVLTNGGDAAFPHRVGERLMEEALGVDPEVVPGSPAGVPEGKEQEWRAFNQRVSGTYKFVDFLPPGLIASILGRMTRPKLSEAGRGCLALEGLGKEPAFLYPDGEIGRYRMAAPIANGERVVIEERGSRVHLWVSILHMVK